MVWGMVQGLVWGMDKSGSEIGLGNYLRIGSGNGLGNYLFKKNSPTLQKKITDIYIYI